MRKFILLVGLIVFLTPMVVSAESVSAKKESNKIYKDELKIFKSTFESELPKCKIKKEKTKTCRKDERGCPKEPKTIITQKIANSSPDECHGKIEYLSNGKIYIGEFKKFEDDKYYYHGEGFFTFAYNTKNQIIYRGQWVKGKKQGEGIQTKLNEKYVGNWELGKYHGHGTLALRNGSEKTGEWVKGNLENKILGKIYCQKYNLDVYYINLGSSGDCLPDKEINFEQFKKIAFAYKESYGIDQNSRRMCFDYTTGNIISCGVAISMKKSSFDEFAISLGCGIERKDVDDCVRRYLPSIIGTGPMNLEDIEEIKKDKEIMGEIVFVIEEMNRQQNQSQNQEPTEEEKQQAMAQPNASSNPTWMYTSGGIGYWNYGNGFGWAPPNPIRDKIIQGLMVSQRTKNMLKTGSKGRTIFFAPIK